MTKLLRAIIILFLISTPLQKQARAQTTEQLKKIDRFIRQNLDKSHIPGLSISIVNKNQITFAKGYGKDGNNKSINPDTPFAIASLSKSFTAMAVMQLVEAGKIHLDDPIKKYIPSFEMNDTRASQITVRHVLNQTSGLSDVVYPELSFKHQPASTINTIENLKDIKLSSTPGEKFHYHNPNYHILALLVEVASREKFSDYLQKHILTPLQMSHTSNYHSTLEFRKHLPKGNVFLLGYPLNMNEPNWFIEGSAGMVSTTNDLAKWLRLYINNGEYEGKKLLSKQGIDSMFATPTGSSYGMGWFVDDQKNVSHSGVLWTYQAAQMILVKEGYGIVILFNSGINAYQDYTIFLQGVQQILANQPPPDSHIPNMIYEWLMAALIVLMILITIIRFRNLKKWLIKHRSKPTWVVWAKSSIRLLPLLFLLMLPTLGALVTMRVLNWERIFLIMPMVIIWLGVVAVCNLLIVISRIIGLNNR